MFWETINIVSAEHKHGSIVIMRRLTCSFVLVTTEYRETALSLGNWAAGYSLPPRNLCDGLKLRHWSAETIIISNCLNMYTKKSIFEPQVNIDPSLSKCSPLSAHSLLLNLSYQWKNAISFHSGHNLRKKPSLSCLLSTRTIFSYCGRPTALCLLYWLLNEYIIYIYNRIMLLWRTSSEISRDVLRRNYC